MARITGFLVAIIWVLCGCGGGNLKDKVVGSWKFDTSSISGKEITPEIKKGFETMFASARLDFKADGTYSASGVGPVETGKWTLDGKALNTISDKGDDKSKPLMTLSDDGSKIHLTFSQDHPMEMDMIKG